MTTYDNKWGKSISKSVKHVKLVAQISKRQERNEELEVFMLQKNRRGGKKWDETGSADLRSRIQPCFREFINNFMGN
jgi:hypothetical protein